MLGILRAQVEVVGIIRAQVKVLAGFIDDLIGYTIAFDTTTNIFFIIILIHFLYLSISILFYTRSFRNSIAILFYVTHFRAHLNVLAILPSTSRSGRNFPSIVSARWVSEHK